RVFSVFHLSATQHTSPSLVPYTTLFRSDGPFDGGGPDGRTSVWAWQPHIKAQILQGIGYWANVLQLQGDQGPAVLNVGTDSEERSEEHTSELQSRENLVCRLLLEKKKKN